MAPLPTVTDVISMQLHWSLAGDPNVTTRLYLKYSGSPPTVAQADALAAAAVAAFPDSLQPLVSTTSGLSSVVCTDLGSTSGARGEASGTAGGSRSGGSLAPGTAMLCNYEISRRYRGGKPRSYFPFGVAGDISDAEWTGSIIDAATTGLTDFLHTFVGVTTDGLNITSQCNVSYYEGFTNVAYGSPTRYRRVPTLRGTPVVDLIGVGAFAFPPSVASQRRRNRPR